jgi:DNA-binding response OmpR family regulator
MSTTRPDRDKPRSKSLHSGARLLVVDDEEAMRRSLADILRLEGYDVETAEDGDSAIAMLKLDQNLENDNKHPFDLILLDLKMPGTDGLDVLRFVTESGREHNDSSTSHPYVGRRPIVILLTAHGSLESAIEALRYGAQDYLLKPSSPEQILKSVAKGLETHADRLQKQELIEQLETSLFKLKNLETPPTGTGPGYPTGAAATAAGSLTPIRETSPWEREKKVVRQTILLDNGWMVDLARREIYLERGATGNATDSRLSLEPITIKLTPTEGKLIKIFLENQKRVFTHRELVSLVHGYVARDWEAAEVLRPLISRLRRKLGQIPPRGKYPGGNFWIISVRGTGYVFDMSET